MENPWGSYSDYSPSSGYGGTYSSELTPIEPAMPSHLPTVLPEHPVNTHNDYPMYRIKTSSPETMESCSTMTPLQSAATHTYDTGYTSGGGGGFWGGTCTGPNTLNYNYYNTASPVASGSQNYPPPHPPAPSVVLYPSFSTVNQNQIHLHLHHNDLNKQIEHYSDDVATIVGNNVNSSGGPRAIEIEILHNNQMQQNEDHNEGVIARYNDRQHGDSSFWRPY